jgi:hypothetical protein
MRHGCLRRKIAALEKCEIARPGPVERRNIHDAPRPRPARNNRRAGQARNVVNRETCGLS